MHGGLNTELEFYEDPYRQETTAWVDAQGRDHKGRQYLVLSNTIFHPHGGGQKGDRGYIEISHDVAQALGVDAKIPIIDTRRIDDVIAHVVGAELDPDRLEESLVGTEKVGVRLDWTFRSAQMRLHSSAHLLHCFVEGVLGQEVRPPETSDLQDDYGLNRYDQQNLLDQEQMNHVLESLNAFVAEDHAIKTYPDTSTSARPGARVWECESWKIPCGGTHPNSTTEIGTVTGELSTKRGRTSMTFRVS